MGDTTIKKVSSPYSPKGKMGQKYLASGKSLSMRLWERIPPDTPPQPSQRDYEVVGYALEGQAELHLENQMVLLNPGDCWVIPRGANHYFKIIKPFTAIEATAPPSHVHDREA
jgi:quercetin dioxygenase-like cupin family protein